MKYDYLVLHNGVYYKPGEEVPNDEPKTEKVEATEVVEEKTEVKSQPGRKKKAQ